MSNPSDYPGTPRWVRTMGWVTLGIVLLLGAVMLFSGGQHGPMRHLTGSGASPEQPTVGIDPASGDGGQAKPAVEP